MLLGHLSTYVYFFAWIFLAVFSYIYNSNFIFEPLLIYFTGTALYYTYYAVMNYKLPIYFKGAFLFVFILTLYGIFLIFLGDDIYWQTTGRVVRKYLYILWLIPSLLSVIPVYVFTNRGLIGEREMKILFLMFFACGIYAYYGGLEQQIAYATLMKTGQDEYTVTSVYLLLSILPLVSLFKKNRILQFFFLGVMFIYFILSAKRGVILLGGASALMLVLSMFKNQTIGKKFLILLISLGLLIGLYFFVNHQMMSSPYFALRIEKTLEGDASGRDVYAQLILDYYLHSTSSIQFLFGIGAQGSLSVNESFAHNDWIAILLEQGLLGACIYFFYWIGFVIIWIKSRLNYDAFVVIGLLLMIGLGKSVFSMYYLPISPEMMASSGFYAIALGYYLAKVFPQEEVKDLNE